MKLRKWAHTLNKPILQNTLEWPNPDIFTNKYTALADYSLYSDWLSMSNNNQQAHSTSFPRNSSSASWQISSGNPVKPHLFPDQTD
jgi:hypothetical protein